MQQENPQQYQDDEIDLFELWSGLVEEKLTVFMTAGVLVILAIVFVMISPKTYESKSSFLPPLEKEAAAINYPEVVSLSSTDLYQKFIDKLVSPEILFSLVDNPVIQEIAGHVQERDLKAAKIESLYSIDLPVEAKQKSLIEGLLLSTLVSKGTSPSEALLLNQQIIDQAQDAAKQELISDLILTIDSRMALKTKQYIIENLRIDNNLKAEVQRLQEADDQERSHILEQISLLRYQAKQNREYKIIRLESDYLQAKKLGISEPINPQDYKRKIQGSTVIDVTNNLPSGYWLGTEILGSEIQKLQARTNEDPYVKGLSELKQKLKDLDVNHRIQTILARKNNEPFSEVLRGLEVDKKRLMNVKQAILDTEFNMVRIVQQPIASSKPIKPNKSLIIAVAAVLGLMLGVFIALIRQAVKKRKAS